MRSVQVITAISAIIGAAAAATTCTSAINVQSTSTTIDCDVVDAEVVINETVTGTLDLSGPSTFKKGLKAVNVKGLLGITSTTAKTIQGTLSLQNLSSLASFDFQSLTSIEELEIITTSLSKLTLGTKGVTSAKKITISDTHISDLNNLNVASVDTMSISINKQLKSFNSKLENVTGTLSFSSNNPNMQINMSMLESAQILDLRMVQSFDAPMLETVGRLSVQESPQLLSVSANNLTKVTDSLTLVENVKLTNISFMALKNIQGDLTVQNNTKLEAIDTFPKLETVGGAILLTGTFGTVKLPELATVNGTVNVVSSTDISSFCKYFDDLKSNKKVKGKERCQSNVTTADQPGSKNGTSGGKGSDDKDNAAGITSASTALFAVVAGAVLAQLL